MRLMQRTRGTTLLIAALLTGGTLAAQPQRLSRVPNGDFETSADTVTGWRVFNLAGDAFSAEVSPNPNSGARALHLARTAGGDDAGVDQWDHPVRVLPREVLVLTFAARKTAGDARSRLLVSVHEFSVTGTLLEEGHHQRIFEVPTDPYRAFSWRIPLRSPLVAFACVGFRLGDADGAPSYPGGYLVDDVALAPNPALADELAQASGPPVLRRDVRDDGATGDGEADDTAAFQRALNACHLAGGGIVEVPAGRYLIAGNLVIPASVTLKGTWQAPAIPARYSPPGRPPDMPKPFAGSVLLATAGAGEPNGTPFIRLDRNACLEGVSIVYPEQTRTDPPVPYPWTIATVGADNCSVVNVFILNPYQAVDFGSHASGRHYVRGLYADPLRRGLYIDQCLDVGRVQDVHFWPFYDTDLNGDLRRYVLENCEAFIVGRTDWEYLTNCFAYGQRIGFHFIRGTGAPSHAGPGNVLVTQSGSDMADMSILVDELQGHSGLLASNSQFFGDVVVGEANVGPMRFSNCGFYGSIHARRGVGQALLDGRGTVAFQNCHFIALHPRNRAAISIRANAGALSLVGCEFMTAGRQQVLLGEAVRRAVLTGNQFAGRMAVENRSSGRVAISANVDDAPVMPEGAVLIDDSDPGDAFSVTGTWHHARQAGCVMQTCRWSQPAGPDARAQWRFTVPNDGRYALEIWYGPDPNDDHATDASFLFRNAGDEHRFPVNFKTNTSRWNRLGVFTVGRGDRPVLVLPATGNGNLVADAARLVPVVAED